MKKLLLLLTIISSFSCCNNDDDNTPTNPIDQLPPATQTGEQTFGCLINGEPFIPPSFGSNSPSAFYQFVDGAYTLGINGSTGGGNTTKFIIIQGLDVDQLIETNYLLESENSDKFSAIYSFGGGNIIPQTLITEDENAGTLTITNFDQDNFIISGTFEFTVLDSNGNNINITNGRFDMNYTN